MNCTFCGSELPENAEYCAECGEKVVKKHFKNNDDMSNYSKYIDDDLYKKVKEIISEQLGVSPDEIMPNASFVDDLGADSLDLTELIMAMEEEFDIEICDDDAQEIRLVSEAVRYIRDRRY